MNAATVRFAAMHVEDPRHTEACLAHEIAEHMAAVADTAAEGQPLLTALACAMDDLKSLTWRQVQLARGQGRSWEAIGEALGMSRQAAWQKFGDA